MDRKMIAFVGDGWDLEFLPKSYKRGTDEFK